MISMARPANGAKSPIRLVNESAVIPVRGGNIHDAPRRNRVWRIEFHKSAITGFRPSAGIDAACEVIAVCTLKQNAAAIARMGGVTLDHAGFTDSHRLSGQRNKAAAIDAVGINPPIDSDIVPINRDIAADACMKALGK